MRLLYWIFLSLYFLRLDIYASSFDGEEEGEQLVWTTYFILFVIIVCNGVLFPLTCSWPYVRESLR